MVEELSPEELKELLDDGDVQVIDVRPPRAFAAGHIPGAVNLPFSEFARRVDEVEWADPIVVACPHGESSRQACRLLESYEGIDSDARIANLSGGYDAWDYELEAE